MEQIIVSPLLYVLRLENNKYYIGTTYNLNFRYAQHAQGHGAKWTRLHKPVEVVRIIMNSTPQMENDITREYMALYGKDNVRGGSWCQL